MVAIGTPQRDEAVQAAEALIEEARRRQRRRRRVVAAVLGLILAIGVVGLAAGGGGRGQSPRPRDHGSHPAPRPSAPQPQEHSYPSVTLPAGDLFNQISVTAGGLLLTGTVASTGSSVLGGSQQCVSAPVDPQSLAIGTVSQGSCDDPALFGRTVMPVIGSPDSADATVAIAHVDRASGQVLIGPTVMTFGDYSDTHPVTVYGGGWMWLYDVNTTNGPELLQVSDSTGDVVGSWQMPHLVRPLLSANDDGLWIGNSFAGGTFAAAPPSALYFIAPGSSSPSVVIEDSEVPVCWLQADGTSVWLGTGPHGGGCAKETFMRFDDGDLLPVFQTADAGSPVFTVVGGAPDLWTAEWSPTPLGWTPGESNSLEVVRLDPDSGAIAPVATLPATPVSAESVAQGMAPGQAVPFDGSLFLLQPPFRQGGYLGFSTLVRLAEGG